MTKYSTVYCPKCGVANPGNRDKCKACNHRLPSERMSWLEFVGILTLAVIGFRLLIAIIPHAPTTQPTPRPQSAQDYETYEELEQEIAAEIDILAEATAQHIESIASTAQAEIFREQAEAAIAELAQTAPLYEIDDCINWAKAHNRIGQNTCVYGDVTSTYDSDNAFFINFTDDRTAFYAISFDWTWSRLEGDCIVVYGTIETYEGRPQIVIHDLNQLRDCY